MSLTDQEQTLDLLSKDDLKQMLIFINRCLVCSDETEFNNLLRSFSTFLDFEFVLYCYTKQSYKDKNGVRIVNLSNPDEWAMEYEREEYLTHDPVRHEVERVLATGVRTSFILWDSYTWELSPMQQLVIARRNHFGLNYGFSLFTDSESKDFFFLFSFASKTTPVTPRAEIISKLLGSHLMVARKRLVIKNMVATLSDKEKTVAEWIKEGKTNSEIANILHVTVDTVKFHNKKIFLKLQVFNRQQAVALLLADRYLGA